MTDELKELLSHIQKYFEREFGDTIVDWSDPRHIHLAYTEDEEPPYAEMQVEADLIDYKFRFFYGGKLVDEDTAKDRTEFIFWLRFMSFDDLIGGCKK